MKVNKLLFLLFLFFVLFFSIMKTWHYIPTELINDIPCRQPTKIFIANQTNKSIEIELVNVSFIPEIKNTLCISSVINIEQVENKIKLISGFNNRFYILLSHLVPIIIFIFWNKKFLSSNELLVNLFCWVLIFQIIFLYFNELNIINYFSIPYLVLIYIYFIEIKND